MPTKVKVEDVEYIIQPIPPSLLPYATLYLKLATSAPEDLEDAQRIGDQIHKALDKVLEETVSPSPKKEHKIALFQAVNALSREIVSEALEPFRPKRPINKTGGRPSSSSASTPKQPS